MQKTTCIVHGCRHIDLLIAVGVVLTFAVTDTVFGISLATVGTILIVLGIIGLLISMVFLMQARRADAVATRERFVKP